MMKKILKKQQNFVFESEEGKKARAYIKKRNIKTYDDDDDEILKKYRIIDFFPLLVYMCAFIGA